MNNHTDKKVKLKEKPLIEDDTYHSISSQSPIFNRSHAFLKSHSHKQPEQILNGSNSATIDFFDKQQKRCALERLKVLTKKQPSKSLYSKEDIPCDLYSRNKKYSPCFNDNSLIGWPSESESNSSCDETEIIPLSKIVHTKRSESDKKCVKKQFPSKNTINKASNSINTQSLGKFATDCFIGNPVKRSEVLRIGNRTQSRLKKDLKDEKILASDNEKKINVQKLNGSRKGGSKLLDLHGFQKPVSCTLHTSTGWTTPDKNSNNSSLINGLPVTPDLFDSSPSPTGFKFTKVTTPETPYFVPLNCDKGPSSRVRAKSPDSPDLVFLGATGPQFPISPPSTRRKRAGVHGSELKRHRKKHKINETQSEDDIVQLVEQMNKDEDFAKKLQEEMDKEFAFSLAQSETVHQFPTPQLPVLPPHNNGPDHFHHGWQTPTSLHRHHSVPQFHTGRMSDEIEIENHLLALLEETPPRRGRRGGRAGRGTRRQPRSRYGFMIQSPIGDGNDYDALLQLAERMGDVQHKGISNNQINRLPIKKFRKCDKNNSASEECSICMCEYEDSDCMRILPCFHCFHSGCVDQWLTNNASCPVCRVDIKLD